MTFWWGRSSKFCGGLMPTQLLLSNQELLQEKTNLLQPRSWLLWLTLKKEESWNCEVSSFKHIHLQEDANSFIPHIMICVTIWSEHISKTAIALKISPMFWGHKEGSLLSSIGLLLIGLPYVRIQTVLKVFSFIRCNLFVFSAQVALAQPWETLAMHLVRSWGQLSLTTCLV